MSAAQSNGTKLDLLINDFAYMKDDISEIKANMRTNLITRVEFESLKARIKLLERAVYGAIGIILTAFIVFLTAQWKG